MAINLLTVTQTCCGYVTKFIRWANQLVDKKTKAFLLGGMLWQKPPVEPHRALLLLRLLLFCHCKRPLISWLWAEAVLHTSWCPSLLWPGCSAPISVHRSSGERPGVTGDLLTSAVSSILILWAESGLYKWLNNKKKKEKKENNDTSPINVELLAREGCWGTANVSPPLSEQMLGISCTTAQQFPVQPGLQTNFCFVFLRENVRGAL